MSVCVWALAMSDILSKNRSLPKPPPLSSTCPDIFPSNSRLPNDLSRPSLPSTSLRSCLLASTCAWSYTIRAKRSNNATYFTDFNDSVTFSLNFLILPPPHSFMHDPIPSCSGLCYMSTMLMNRTMGSLTYGVSKVCSRPNSLTYCFEFPLRSANTS